MSRAKRQGRQLVVTLSLTIHAALVALLLHAAPKPSMGHTDGFAINVSLLDGKAAVSQAAPRARPSHPQSAAKAPAKAAPALDIVPQYVNFEPPADEARLNEDPNDDPVAVSVTAASAAAGHACDVGAWLQSALQADPSVRLALTTIPPSSRSVANAIMLWDSHWTPQPMPAVAGVSALRSAMMVGVRSAPVECQSQLVRGPELIALADAHGTILLAVGSGEWRWGDLLAPDTGDLALASLQAR